MPYLSVHFKEKITPDGEQVYFAVSKDGFNWEQVNDGNPVLTAKLGEKGCRDIEIVRLHTGGFMIVTTDLCIAYRFYENYNIDWKHVNSHGSKCLRMWKTEDFTSFSEERLVHFGRDDFGCMWAPEVFFDEENQEYLIHWGSTVAEDNFTHMSIYCSTTKDFETFSVPKMFFTKENEILDSHLLKIGDTYHLYYKNAHNPGMNMHSTSKCLYGPYEHDGEFQKLMEELDSPGAYEGPTTYRLPDGRWCLMLDFFGCDKPKMGYVPWVSETDEHKNFKMCKREFSFPYGFKHGRFIEITEQEYENLKGIKRA